ncbi:DNA-binding protein [Burkholderia multivorans]|uniref:DNA-binding protein n=1 Tax=Burkholderia multivorans TaxID=87883 RepID=UPI001C26B0B8|nr:DNA-binding protein [Burkholderia multivorans]MBU9552738.1 DNA-binding protein [Burkholderia multivorans]
MELSVSVEIRERIIAAANQLFEQAGRAQFPAVDAVRRLARANMGDTSAVMKEWRRAQTAQAAPVGVEVPESIREANRAALATLWSQAQELANESLRTAQAAWETERAEADTLRAELASAFESQAGELEAAQARIVELERQAQDASAAAAEVLATVRAELADVTTRAERAEAKAGEIERRADELRVELDRAHSDVDRLQADLLKATKASDAIAAELAAVRAKADAQAEAHQEHRKQTAQEASRQAERFTKVQAERDEAVKVTADARENAAKLAGQLEAVQAQNAALLARLTPPVGDVPPAGAKGETQKKR